MALPEEARVGIVELRGTHPPLNDLKEKVSGSWEGSEGKEKGEKH